MDLKEIFPRGPNESLILFEHNYNYLFQGRNRSTTVAEDYQPEKGAQYQMPYVWLSLDDEEVESFFASPDELLEREVRQGNLIKFFIHPEMISEYKERGYEKLLRPAGYQKVVPTASTRTVMTLELPYAFMIKVNMTKRVGLLSRKLTRTSVAQSHQIMVEMNQIKECAPPFLAYLPETIGVVYKTEVGEIFRQCQAWPKVQEERYLIPFFSLISSDKQHTEDPLICQIIEMQGGNEWEVFEKTLLIPLLDSWKFLVFERGILPIMHFQNLLLEVNKEGSPTRIVFRDLQDCTIDGNTRISKGLHIKFSRHFVDDVGHFQIYVDGEQIKDSQRLRQVNYSLAWDFWLALLFDCFGIVLSKYHSCSREKLITRVKEYFQENIQTTTPDLFPQDQFVLKEIDPENPRVRSVENRGCPKYR